MKATLTTADTENTEGAQRVELFSLCHLCGLCASVVNNTVTGAQGKLNCSRLLFLACYIEVGSLRYNGHERA
jgi:hypothetical protein